MVVVGRDCTAVVVAFLPDVGVVRLAPDVIHRAAHGVCVVNARRTRAAVLMLMGIYRVLDCVIRVHAIIGGRME